MSRRRNRDRSHRKPTWLERWRARYPDPKLAQSSNPPADLVAAFGVSWIARRWHDRKRR